MKDNVTFTLRVPTGLYDRLKKSAEADKRSVNSQCLYYFEKGIIYFSSDSETSKPDRGGK